MIISPLKSDPAREARLRGLAKDCTRILVDKYHVRSVVLFGSLAEHAVTAWSDIDIAVEGLEPALYFKALADLRDLLPADVDVDLVPIEKALPPLKSRVAQSGERVYG
jgi:predicted nucleotidyltransferase